MRVVLSLCVWSAYLLSCHFVAAETVNGTFKLRDKWPGEFGGEIRIHLTKTYRFGWLIYVTFDIPVSGFVIDETRQIGEHPSKKMYVFTHLRYNKILHNPASGHRNFQCRGKTPSIPQVNALLIPLEYEGENSQIALNRAINGVVQKKPSSSAAPSTTTTTTTTTSTDATQKTSIPWWEKVLTARTTFQPTITTESTAQSTTPDLSLASMNLRYNLREVITKSLLFFEAQRSGLLPPNNRISWRSHSALRDGLDRGVDLSGGYYIDGGYVKYGFPMAFSTTLLAWSLLEFRNAYLASYQIPHLMKALKWSTDYFLKCHVSKFEFYGQVSTTKIDGGYWGRPEDFKSYRPAFKITKQNPGSDLAAETAAAMAATAIVFQTSNATYSKLLIRHAKNLYSFADLYRGEYHKTIKDAEKSYKSWSGFWDELAWGALWLYKATGERTYLDVAKNRLKRNPHKDPLRGFNWDDKRAGAIALLTQITNENKYRFQLTDFCDYMVPGGGAQYTPGRLLYLDEWGPIRHAANVGYICLLAAKLGIRSRAYRRFAHGQLSYMLGDSGRSYVVGFGQNSPTQPHHRASSCPNRPAPCSWNDKDLNKPNPQILTGAVVGGPNKWDAFEDHRRDYRENSVAIDYNAGVQSLAAGILELQVTGQTFSEPNPQELQAAISQGFAVKHDYGEIIRKSLLFYEAQRSGRLPANNRIPWRRSAFVNDTGDGGRDLSGGYFDAGDYVKFNFPMAYTTTVLAWGVMQYGQAYDTIGEMANVKSAIKWATDYFIKCHVSKFELYGQVGSGVTDHSHWTTPQGMANVMRPAYKLTAKSPGSELVAETAAAMAAASIVFRSSDSNYSTILVGHARDLYDFATMHRERYHRSITDAANFYRSFSGYEDELAWAAVWLYLATQQKSYLTKAEILYRQIPGPHRSDKGFFWDQKTAGVQLLLAQITKKRTYINAIQAFCDGLQPGRGVRYTPKGLVFLNNWGPLRHAAGVAYICLGVANLGIKPYIYRNFGKRQIHYMLGDTGLGSYVIGYGPSPPTRPHHRASSCPSPPAKCSFDALRSTASNPHTLYGALVGGPNIKDEFYDDRNNHKFSIMAGNSDVSCNDVLCDERSNEVAMDYNACFQSAVAALKYLELYPPATTTTTGASTLPPTTTTTTTSNPQATRSGNDDEAATTGGLPNDYFEDYWNNAFVENDTDVANVSAVQSTALLPAASASPEALTGATAAITESPDSNTVNKTRLDCAFRTITKVFDKCKVRSTQAQILPAINSTTLCRWKIFQDCTSMDLEHCTETWAIFRFWNIYPRDQPHFTDKARTCSVETIPTVPPTVNASALASTSRTVRFSSVMTKTTPSSTTMRTTTTTTTTRTTKTTTTTDALSSEDYRKTVNVLTTRRVILTSPRVIRLGSTPLQLTTTELPVSPGGSCTPLSVFDKCAIKRTAYPTHRIRSRFRCRYTALQVCIRRLGSGCQDVWASWSYWNNGYATEEYYFTESELKCLEPGKEAKVNCKVSGITNTFAGCKNKWYTPTSATSAISARGDGNQCRWKLFKACVNKQVGHCLNTWQLFILWNDSKAGAPHFTKQQQLCSSALDRKSGITLLIASFSFFSFTFVWTCS